MYNQEDEYFKNNSQGYIIDRKTGTKHDVVDASYNSDSGAIAGGTINWVLYISNVGPIKKLKVSGYQSIMSSPSTNTATRIISHISDGYYLEDYLAIHQKDIAKGGQEKMDAWHNGTRKQNVKNCSDDKLKAYYKICVDSGYDEEAEKLRSEVDSRGLKLNESISLSTYAELF